MLRILFALIATLGLLASPASAAQFKLCHPGGPKTCVVDGDTFKTRGRIVRIQNIDAPETHPSRCAREARLGKAATDRLIELLNRGSWALATAPDEHRNKDRHGRLLRLVVGPDGDFGQVLIDEGLARPWVGKRQPWC